MYRNEQLSYSYSSGERTFLTEVLPSDFLCSEGLRLTDNKFQHPGNKRFAAIFVEHRSLYISSSKSSASNCRDAIDFIVSTFMIEAGGRFLRRVDDQSVFIALTKIQAVEWLYNCLNLVSKNEPPAVSIPLLDYQARILQWETPDSDSNEEQDDIINRQVASILDTQRNILVTMRMEGKIENNLANLLPISRKRTIQEDSNSDDNDEEENNGNLDNEVASILNAQKDILMRMKTEGKINHNLQNFLPPKRRAHSKKKLCVSMAA